MRREQKNSESVAYENVRLVAKLIDWWGGGDCVACRAYSLYGDVEPYRGGGGLAADGVTLLHADMIDV